jgi:hypothetical protein
MKSDQIFAEKCDFNISVFHPEKQFPDILDVIQQKFESVFYEDEFGEQNGFIASLVNQRLQTLQNAKVYLVNLKEKEGSYILEFALIIISAIGNYGGVREGLDYLKVDIFSILKNKLGEEYTVNVDYTVTEITEKEKKKPSSLFNLDIDGIVNDRRLWIAATAFMFFLLVVSKRENPKEEAKSTVFDESRVEQILDKKFDDYIKNRKMDMILERLILQPDTIYTNK